MPNWEPCKICDTAGTVVLMGDYCIACGESNHGALRLTGSTGLFKDFKITTRIGNQLLKKIDPDNAKYASAIQFEVKKTDEPFWIISIVNNPTYRTFVNGDPLSSGSTLVLSPGDFVSIEDRVLKLKVDLV